MVIASASTNTTEVNPTAGTIISVNGGGNDKDEKGKSKNKSTSKSVLLVLVIVFVVVVVVTIVSYYYYYNSFYFVRRQSLTSSNAIIGYILMETTKRKTKDEPNKQIMMVEHGKPFIVQRYSKVRMFLNNGLQWSGIGTMKGTIHMDGEIIILNIDHIKGRWTIHYNGKSKTMAHVQSLKDVNVLIISPAFQTDIIFSASLGDRPSNIKTKKTQEEQQQKSSTKGLGFYYGEHMEDSLVFTMKNMKMKSTKSDVRYNVIKCANVKGGTILIGDDDEDENREKGKENQDSTTTIFFSLNKKMDASTVEPSFTSILQLIESSADTSSNVKEEDGECMDEKSESKYRSKNKNKNKMKHRG
jgi:hypothetical protein